MSDSLIVFVLCIITALFLAWVIVLKHQMIKLHAEEKSLCNFLDTATLPAQPVPRPPPANDPWRAGDDNVRTS